MKENIILDTNVISDIMNLSTDPHVADWIASIPPDRLFLTSITIDELVYGLGLLPDGKRKRGFEGTINAVIRNYADRTFSFHPTDALICGAVRARRRRLGQPIGLADAQIAAIAKHNNCTVATRNIADFQHIGVRLINPWNYTSPTDHTDDRPASSQKES